MKLNERIQNAFKALTKNDYNSTPIGRQFFKYGNRKMLPDWSQVLINDEDMYKGYSYAAIRKRSKRTAQMGTENVKSRDKENEIVEHPYLTAIDKSLDFSNYFFWYSINTFLDIKGVYYLMAVRAVNDNRVGDVQEFKLLNPYNIKRVVNKDTGVVEGYIETQDEYQLVREIPKEMIIEMRELNPFSDDKPFSMIDAAKESQFTMKQSSDYTRHAIKNNMASPGIIGTDVLLPDEEFENFKARVINQEKGVPLFGNGSGAITYESMQQDLDKAALDKINEINRDQLFAVAGVSKTTMGIEQSGTTRETAKVQSDAFVISEITPRLQDIIDALNQDYKRYYTDQYNKTGITIYIDSPLGTDKDDELKDIDIRDKQYALYSSLVEKGYDREQSAMYANGEIMLSELTEPIVDEQEPETPNDTQDEKNQQEQAENSSHSHDNDGLEIITNKFDEDQQGILNNQQAALQSAVINIEEELVGTVINKLTKVNNAFETSDDIITDTERNRIEKELVLAIATFYGVIMPLYATTVMNRRANEFGEFATFKMNNDVKTYIKTTANKAAESHINTIVKDLLVTTQQAALEGASQEQLVAMIKQKYSGTISTTRATAIARTETNRAFTMSQYQADVQFLKQNDLTGSAYKKWITRSDNPCPLCQEMAAQPPIPFKQPFAEVGDVISATYEQDGKTKVLKQTVGFEDALAGNLHVNCACIYQLIIE